MDETGRFRGLARRLGSRGRESPTLSAAGQPFTAQEIHQLAFGLPEQWVGIINQDRWRAHGAAVMTAWTARVETERAEHDRNRADGEPVEAIAPRPEPWPVIFYGKPDPA